MSASPAGAGFEPEGPGVWALRGDLSMATVPSLWTQRQRLFAAGGRVTLDLKAVERADSAGLALLVGLLRTATARGTSLHLVGLPEQLAAMARLSGVAGLVGFAEALAGQAGAGPMPETREAVRGENR